ncbi:MAG: hypothetical protein MUE51_05515 [Thermoleophilia bacterium]|nr:hypothetical protein [Thermoleophilia bacterium]
MPPGTDWTAIAARMDAAWPGSLADPGRAAGYRQALEGVEPAAVLGVVESLAASGRADPPPPGFLRTVALARAQQAATAPAPVAAPLPARWIPPPAADADQAGITRPGAGAAAAVAGALVAAAGTLLGWISIRIASLGEGRSVTGRDIDDGRYALYAALVAALFALVAVWLGGRRAPGSWVAGALTVTAAGGGIAAWMAARTWSDVNAKAGEAKALIGTAADAALEQARTQFPQLTQLATLPRDFGSRMAAALDIGVGLGLYLTLAGGVVTLLGAAAAVRRVARGE